jgi:hypothetical protein
LSNGKRKLSKSKNQGKPLTRTVRLDLGQPTPLKGFMVDHSGRIAAIGTDGRSVTPKQAIIETGFARQNPSKPTKVVSQAIVEGGNAFYHVDQHLLTFQQQVFVDTNTREVDGVMLSATAVIRARRRDNLSSGKPVMDLHHDVTFEFRDTKVPAEQLGWVNAIRGLSLGPLKGRPGCIAVVVDHALGDLAAFNHRDKRIAGVMYLPPRIHPRICER